MQYYWMDRSAYRVEPDNLLTGSMEAAITSYCTEGKRRFRASQEEPKGNRQLKNT